jgi:hypothetical protein
LFSIVQPEQMLNNIVNQQEQYGQQNIVQVVFMNIVTGWAFFCCVV